MLIQNDLPYLHSSADPEEGEREKRKRKRGRKSKEEKKIDQKFDLLHEKVFFGKLVGY